MWPAATAVPSLPVPGRQAVLAMQLAGVPHGALLRTFEAYLAQLDSLVSDGGSATDVLSVCLPHALSRQCRYHVSDRAHVCSS